MGRKTRRAPTSSDGLPHPLALVGAEVVEDHGVARLEGRDEELLDIGAEAFAIDGPVEQARRIDAVIAKSGKERRGFPLALRDLVDEALSLRRPAAKPGHVGLGPRLVDEDQTPGIDAALIGSPARAMARGEPVSLALCDPAKDRTCKQLWRMGKRGPLTIASRNKVKDCAFVPAAGV